MSNAAYDVIIVGAGYSGLSASYYLKKQGLSHIIFERGKIAESWRSQRWDSFRMNSTNKLNALPGMDCEEAHANAFGTAPALVSSLEQYVATHQLPVSENSKVISIEKQGELFDVSVLSGDIVKNYLSRQVLIASGAANEINIPAIAENITAGIKQLHTSQYRNANQLPAGAVLVVGGAQSGIQIAEDLLNAGRKVYLSTSEVGRLPRWYRGRDIFYWLMDLKFFDIKAEDVKDPNLFELRPPHISGTGNGRDSLSLQSLAKKGAVLLGKMDKADGQNIFFQPNAAAHVKFADGVSKKIKEMIDEYISKQQISAPAPHHDEADIPDTNADCVSNINSLNLQDNNINTIIWATGFGVDYSYIKLPVFDNNGKLIHKNGIPVIPGLYFLGYPWLLARKSAILFGIIEDVKFVVDCIYDYARGKRPT